MKTFEMGVENIDFCMGQNPIYMGMKGNNINISLFSFAPGILNFWTCHPSCPMPSTLKPVQQTFYGHQSPEASGHSPME